MRSRFDGELDRLNTELIEMGVLVETAIENACRALTGRDAALARETVAGDEAVNRKERQVESLCLRLIWQQQPVAGDLRLVSAAMKMITDMERIGDQAQDIAEIALYVADAPDFRVPEDIAEMAKATAKMVHESVDAFVKRDLTLARAVQAADDQVDAYFVRVKGELAALLTDRPGIASAALDMLMIAKYFERIGDHAVNIAEWVEFAMTGMYKGARL